eukprot:m.306941 g.306941  ORF g.306941 m.306941 type:complete len:59 (-) comp15928_c0_seq1:157-333(-)
MPTTPKPIQVQNQTDTSSANTRNMGTGTLRVLLPCLVFAILKAYQHTREARNKNVRHA